MRACRCSIALLLLLAAPVQTLAGAKPSSALSALPPAPPTAPPSVPPSAPSSVTPPSCHVAVAAPGPDAPPAWLLLAGAVVLLGAGRLAAS